MRESRARFRVGGFTLVELLVVIAIIGVLVALHNYHDGYKSFPPGVVLSESASSTCPPMGGIDAVFSTWTIAVLPFLEETALYDRFDFTLPVASRFNRITGRAQQNGALVFSGTPDVYLCPSDPRLADGVVHLDYAGVAGGGENGVAPAVCEGGAGRLYFDNGKPISPTCKTPAGSSPRNGAVT